MKKIFVIALLLSTTHSINAQTWNELFRQKATQKKYLLQQIVSLQLYADYLSKGYSMARKGLHAIQDIKHGDFNLHSDYFSSLQNISPKIKRYTRTAEIISLQISISKQIIRTIMDCKQSNQLTRSEFGYIQNVFQKVLNDCAEIIDLLNQLIIDNKLSMKDDERIVAIDRICKEMQDNYAFTMSFGNSAKTLCAQRDQEKRELVIEQKLNGLK